MDERGRECYNGPSTHCMCPFKTVRSSSSSVDGIGFLLFVATRISFFIAFVTIAYVGYFVCVRYYFSHSQLKWVKAKQDDLEGILSDLAVPKSKVM